MAVHVSRALEPMMLRADFPIFEQPIHGKRLVYLDSAASAQKPRQVLEAMTDFYETSYANVHRGVYELGERATEALEGAREKVRAFVNAPSAREIIFVRNATEALNLVAYAYGLDNLGPGDVVLTTALEHHSNFVPWQAIAARTGAEFAILPVDDAGELALDELDRFEAEQIKVVAAGAVSNALGTINDVARLAEWAHARGAVFVLDAAQAAPHRPLDVQALGADFVAVSGHKMCGPSGIGFLWGRSELLQSMSPFLYGGHMIRRVGDRETSFGELPAKFEAGTSPMAEAVGLGAAVDYLSAIGLEAIEAHEQALAAYALERLEAIPGITTYGPPPERRAGIVSFNLATEGGVAIHPHDVAQLLDRDGVAIRASHHCCQPLMRQLGVLATSRASFYLYNDRDDVDVLAESVRRAQDTFS
jgi:cysteine desulfurase/selenocysteine lyase